jgi:hypothetical protein
MKKSTLVAGLKAAVNNKESKAVQDKQNNRIPKTILIGGHFSVEVRRTLLLVQAEEENTGKTLKQLLGEAINDLCAKYGKPQPYNDEL